MEIFEPKYAGLAMAYPYGLDHCASLFMPANILNAELILGTLSSNCRGQGICKVLPLGSNAAEQCSSVRATLMKVNQHRLHILFYPQHSCHKVRRRLLSKNIFIVEEPFQLPNWVCNKLSFSGTPVIPAGQYSIFSFDGAVLVHFQLQAGQAAIESGGDSSSASVRSATGGAG